MENRERDRVSQRTTPTEAGELNRRTEEERGRRENSGTSAEFGQSIGRSENLSEGGEMFNRNRDEENVSNKNLGNESEVESSRRSGQGSMGSSSGRKSGSTGQGTGWQGDSGRTSGSSDIGSGSKTDKSSDISSGDRQSRH